MHLSSMPHDRSTALVLLSGGQDSGTCLAWALDRYVAIETVGFAYGQRHQAELTARLRVREALGERWPGKLGSDHVLDLGVLAEIGDTAMTSEAPFGTGPGGLPTTFVPGRNLAFLVMAGALAYRRGAQVLIGGMCGTDAAGYPDCRDEAVQAQAEALRRGMAFDVTVETPLMTLTKAQTWALAEQLGGRTLVETLRVLTHTCYRGVRETLHPWGYGCGDCPACAERARGWADYEAAR